MKEKISIVGFGRFGKTLYRLLEHDFSITVFDLAEEMNETDLQDKTIVSTLDDVYQNKTIFYAVPISQFETVMNEHKKYITDDHILIDTLSVKCFPEDIFEKVLQNKKTQAMLTHPLFGPDSSKNSFIGLSIVIDQFRMHHNNYIFWKQYFERKELKVVEMNAKMHDQTIASSQGVVHFVGRILDAFHFEPTKIDTLGAKQLLAIKEQTCNDTWDLFRDLQQYNPYTPAMRFAFGKAFTAINSELLPEKVNPPFMTFGIQGGEGSFNEEAVMSYIKSEKIELYSLEYLFTTDRVLRNLTQGLIDRGLFAISNSTGGMVEESIRVIGEYRFRILEEINLLIRHFLMIPKDVDATNITGIIAHPQVLKQCEQTLKSRYPHFTLQSGEGDLIDTARAAAELAAGNLSPTLAVLGPSVLAERFGFTIIDENLQDKFDNITKFLLVERI